jgi:hypothetical protein
MQKKDYEVQVIINGKPVREFSHNGKVYIEGRKDTRFSIKIKNNSYSRKLFVPTVDGLSVMDGQEGSYQSSGYIVNAHSAITIEGWRTSNKEVAEFYFSSPEGSYRKRMKKGNNLGAIGVAVFEEKPGLAYTVTATINQPWFQMPYNTPNWSGNTFNTGGVSGSSVNCSASAECSSSNLTRSAKGIKQAIGTGFGDSRESSVISVNFDRCTTPTAIIEILYNTKEELRKAGVDMQKEPLYVTPEAFPGQYCKAPR